MRSRLTPLGLRCGGKMPLEATAAVALILRPQATLSAEPGHWNPAGLRLPHDARILILG